MRPLLSVPFRGAAACALLVALLLDNAHGQEPLSSHASPINDGLEQRFTAIGDVTGDGVTDHVTGAPGANGQQGLASLHSGADGALLATLQGEFSGAQFGWSVAAVHDVDGDGVPDFAVGAPATSVPTATGSVFIYSGANAGLIRRLDGNAAGAGFGYGVAGLGDIDGDGHADLLISSPFANNSRGQVSSYSGDTGALLATRLGGQDGDLYGASIAGTLSSGDGSPEPIIGQSLLSGDGSPEPIIGAALSGDGSPEPIIGAALSGDGSPEPIIGATQAANGGPGYIEILTRDDLTPLATMQGDQNGDRFGWSVSQAGDVDGDGTLDFIVGAHPDTGATPGYARVLSGWDGTTMLLLTDGSLSTGFGSSVAGIGDVDGDGHDDLAVGSFGTVRVFSGLDGSLAQLINGNDATPLGSTVSFAGDLDGDGKADLALSSLGDGINPGTRAIFSLCPATNSSAEPVATRSLTAGSTSMVTLSLRNAPAETPAALLVGFGLVFDGSAGTLNPADDIIVNGLSTDATGSLDYALTLSSGSLIYYQFMIVDPAAEDGLASSNVVATRGSGN